MNANPNDQFSPYMDIVERTGSKVYDMDLKVRVGDLTGLSRTRLLGTDPTAAGFGMYAKNVFLEGGITANTGSIGGIEMQSNKLFSRTGTSITPTFNDADTNFYLDSSGNFSLRDKLSFNSSTGNLNVDGTITVGSLPDIGIVTGSAQIASDISGSGNANSASLAASASSAVATGSTLTTASSSAANVLRLTTSGVDIYEVDGTATKVASYGPTVTIGNTDTEHISITSTEFKLKDGNGVGADRDYITINSSGMQIGSVSDGITLDTNGDAVFNGSITLVGSDIQGLTGSLDSSIGTAQNTADTANTAAGNAQTTANTANTTATALATQVVLNANGMELKNQAANTTLASYGTTTTIGDTTGEHISISSTAFEVKTNSTNTVLSASSAGLEMSGSIIAGSGEIGGWVIGETTLQSATSNPDIVLDKGNEKIEILGTESITSNDTNASLFNDSTDGSSIRLQRDGFDGSTSVDIIKINSSQALVDDLAGDYTTNVDSKVITGFSGTTGTLSTTMTSNTAWPAGNNNPFGYFCGTTNDTTFGFSTSVPNGTSGRFLLDTQLENNVVEVQLQNFTNEIDSLQTAQVFFKWKAEVYQSSNSNGNNAELVHSFSISSKQGDSDGADPITGLSEFLVNKRYWYIKFIGTRFDNLTNTDTSGRVHKLAFTNTPVVMEQFLAKTRISAMGIQTYGGPNQNATFGSRNEIVGDFAIKETSTSTRGQLIVEGSATIGASDIDDTYTLYTEGDIGASGNIVAYATSDEKLKENIVEINDGLSLINQLRPVKFDWKPDSPFGKLKETEYGLIAQEVEKVLPLVVGDMKYDYKGIDYEKIIPILISSIKELSNKVETLEEKLNDTL